MTVSHYLAEVKGGLLLELPREAELLDLKLGDKVKIQIERSDEFVSTPRVNEGMRAALREISERQQGRRESDGCDTVAILREGRAGVMWGSDPVD